MKQFTKRVLCILAMTLSGANALAATDTETVALFKEAGQSASFFSRSYGYAVFPTVAKGGMGIGAAHGKGGVYRNGKLTGSVTLNQLSIGLQLGGQAYSEIIFFEDQRAYDEFVSGNYEVNAGVSAVALTAGASASAGTQGATSAAGSSKDDHTTDSVGYYKGMVIFTVTKGGLMYEASVAGQKFKFKPAEK